MSVRLGQRLEGHPYTRQTPELIRCGTFFCKLAKHPDTVSMGDKTKRTEAASAPHHASGTLSCGAVPCDPMQSRTETASCPNPDSLQMERVWEIAFHERDV